MAANPRDSHLYGDARPAAAGERSHGGGLRLASDRQRVQRLMRELRLRALARTGGPQSRTNGHRPMLVDDLNHGDATRARVDRDAAEAAARDLLVALGADPEDEGLRETPRRVAAAFAELLTPAPFELTTFPNDEGYDELVVVRDIQFQSLCMHHLLPFFGVAHVAYLPGERILGLSKLARVVELFARDLQVQERLTTQIAGLLERELEPRGVGVVLEAEHMCMSLRGVHKSGARTVTSALHGLVRDDPRTREEFLNLTTGRTCR